MTSSPVAVIGSSSGGSSNTAAIVGGVVGGVGGLLVLLGLLWFFLWRRRKHKHAEEFDDMMFDPSRGARHAVPGTTDLVDSGPETVEPYSYPSSAAPQMSQWSGAAAGAAGGAALGSSLTSPTNSSAEFPVARATGDNMRRGPSSASTLTSAGFAGRGSGYPAGEGGYPTLMPAPMPTGGSGSSGPGYSSTSPAATASPAAARKMREAQAERSRNVVNDTAPPTSPTSPSATEMTSGTDSAGVYLHQDGGRFVEQQDELPPQYHSIPGDRR